MGGYRIPNVPYFVSRQRYDSYLRSLGTTLEEERKQEAVERRQRRQETPEQRRQRNLLRRLRYAELQRIARQRNQQQRQRQERAEENRRLGLLRQQQKAQYKFKLSPVRTEEYKYEIEVIVDLMRETQMFHNEPKSWGFDPVYTYVNIPRDGYPFSMLRYAPNYTREPRRIGENDDEFGNTIFEYEVNHNERDPLKDVVYFTKIRSFFANKPISGFTQKQMEQLYYDWFMVEASGPLNVLRGIASAPMYDHLPIGRRRLYGSSTDRMAIVDIDVEEDLLSMDCAVRILMEHMKKSKVKKMNSMTESQILQELNMTDRTSGCILDDLFAFCDKYKIDFKICDVGFNVIRKSEHNQKQAGIFAMVRGSHIYSIKNRSTINRIFKDQKLIEYEKATKENNKCKMCEYNGENLHLHYFEVHEKRKKIPIVNLNSEIFRYIRENKRIPLLNKDLSGFGDKDTIYYCKDSQKSQTKGLKLIKQFYNESHLSVRTPDSSFLFDNTITTFNKTYITTPTKGYTYDLKRQFSAICYKIRFPVYNSYCVKKPFSGIFSSSVFYYVLPSNILNDNVLDPESKILDETYEGWHCMELVKFLYDTKIIKRSDIKYEFVPSSTVSFRTFIEKVYEDKKIEDHEKKDIINLTLGCFAKTKGQIRKQPSIIDNEEDVKYLYNNNNSGDYKQHVICITENNMIDKEDADLMTDIDDKIDKLRIFQSIKEYSLLLSAKPVYSYLLSYSRYVMMEAKKQAEEQGARVLGIKTDSITTDKSIKLKTLFNIEVNGCTMPPYMGLGSWKDAEEGEISEMKYTERIGVKGEVSVKTEEWKKIDEIPNNSVPKSLKETMGDPDALYPTMGHSVLITGMPGCGKSYIAKNFRKKVKIIREIQRKGHKKITQQSNVKWMTFQNNIAGDASGSTFHKILGIKLGEEKTNANLRRRFEGVEYVFIDEVQQTPSEVMKYLIWLKTNLNIKFICMGDFKQWKSIKDNNFNIESPPLKVLCDNNLMHIEGNQRIKDKIFVDALLNAEPYDAIKIVKKNEFTELPKYTITYFSNEKYDSSSYNININTYERIHKVRYPSAPALTKEEIKNGAIPQKEEFKVFVGMPLIAQKSSSKKGIVKGVHYEVIDIDDTFYTIQKSKDFHTVDDNTPTIKIGIKPITEVSVKILTKGKDKGKEIKKEEKYDFYEYFTLGYAFSCHKTIGLTIKAPYIVMNNGKCKGRDLPEYLYVAFSRCNDPKQILFLEPDYEEDNSIVDFEYLYFRRFPPIKTINEEIYC